MNERNTLTIYALLNLNCALQRLSNILKFFILPLSAYINLYMYMTAFLLLMKMPIHQQSSFKRNYYLNVDS